MMVTKLKLATIHSRKPFKPFFSLLYAALYIRVLSSLPFFFRQRELVLLLMSCLIVSFVCTRSISTEQQSYTLKLSLTHSVCLFSSIDGCSSVWLVLWHSVCLYVCLSVDVVLMMLFPQREPRSGRGRRRRLWWALAVDSFKRWRSTLEAISIIPLRAQDLVCIGPS